MVAAWPKAAAGEVLESLKGDGTSMAYVDIVTALAVLQFLVFGFQVGKARGRYAIKAPAISGNVIFERYFRVQQNTLEQLVVFLPGLYLYSHYFNARIAAGIGALYLVGRQIYAVTYVKDPAKRSAGYALSLLPIVVLVFGGIIGAVRSLL
jgi:glutathione S-transferase